MKQIRKNVVLFSLVGAAYAAACGPMDSDSDNATGDDDGDTAGAPGEGNGETGGTSGDGDSEVGGAAGYGGGGMGGTSGEVVPEAPVIDSCDDLPGSSIVENGGFELPVVPVGGWTSFPFGSEFEGWTVIGTAGNVAPLSGQYIAGGTDFAALHGEQTMDLTGVAAQASGIAQTVETSVGQQYCLSFWSGNALSWGPTSTVEVSLNDEVVKTATNSLDGSGNLAWEYVQVLFVADSTETTLAFTNRDPSNDNSNIIDTVVLKAVD